MQTVRNYLEQAKECDELARNAVTDEERKTVQRIASTWPSLAEQRAKMLKTIGKIADSGPPMGS